jgi:prepilin-type N-terminal cleavage/methylation domain-containing protein
MHRLTSHGVTLIELAVVLTVLGLMMAIGAAGYGRYADEMSLKGASGAIVQRLRLTRDRAFATKTSRTMLFQAATQGFDYRVEVGGVVQAGWNLPRRVAYNWLSGTITSVTFTPDGRCSTSGLVILQDVRGRRDTVSVLSSGLVLVP